MVRAIVDFDEADYERVRKAASDRGVTVETFVASQALRDVPNTLPAAEPSHFKSMREYFDWIDTLKLSTGGWKWNREELYDRNVLR